MKRLFALTAVPAICALAALAGVAAIVPAASARSGAHVKLSVLPLPKSSLGSAAQRLRLEHDSGVRPKWRLVGLPVTPNRSFIAESASPGARDAIRISGYALDYGLGASGRAGVTEVWTSIDQYKTSADAKKGLSLWKREDRRVLWHKSTRGLAMAIKAEKVAPVGSGRFAFLVSYRAANIAPLFGFDEQFTRGRYEAEVTVWAGTAAAAEKLAPNLATKLEERIKLALAGRLHAKPVKLPRQEAGPLPGGPHLLPLRLKPTDLGVQASRYRWDHGYGTRWDRSALSYYFDNLFTAQFDFSQEIGWFATVNQASFTADFEFALASFDGSSLDLSSVGDGAEGFLANPPNYADLVFSSGQLEEHVTFFKYSPISTSEVRKMAQTVADKINSAGLGS